MERQKEIDIEKNNKGEREKGKETKESVGKEERVEGKEKEERKERKEKKEERKKRGAIAAVLALLLAGAALFILGRMGMLSGNLMRYLLQICLYIVLGQSWNMLSGFAGMTSLGQQLYVGLAGYALTVGSAYYGLSLPGCLGLALGVSFLTALLLSNLFFRIQGVYFGIATWVAAEAMQMFFLSWKYVNQGGGMTAALSPYPSTREVFLLSLVLCYLVMAIICVLLKSKVGLALLAMRDDPEGAMAIGIHLRRIRLFVYVLAALFTALCGVLFFVNKGVIYPDSGFSVSWTVSAVFICIIGGTGTVEGPVVGAVLYVLLREILAHYPGWSNIFLGIITILIIVFLPEGIVGSLHRRFHLPLFSDYLKRRPEEMVFLRHNYFS